MRDTGNEVELTPRLSSKPSDRTRFTLHASRFTFYACGRHALRKFSAGRLFCFLNLSTYSFLTALLLLKSNVIAKFLGYIGSLKHHGRIPMTKERQF